MPNPALTLVVAGPTAAGKTEFATALAARCGAEIISADSRQIYQKLDIGTGKPTNEQLRQAPHALVSSVPPDQAVTAENFAHMADDAAAAIRGRGKAVMVVGGTGLWIRAFIDGLAPVPAADPVVRQALQEELHALGAPALHGRLAEVDPESAAIINHRDAIRIVRALEIYMQTGRPASALRKEASHRPVIPALWIGVERPREILYQRAQDRIRQWLQAGWLEEVRNLLAEGYSPEAPALQAIGYSHLVRHLREGIAWDQTVEWIQRDTRRYIKRQLTWFKAEKRMCWLDLVQGLDQALDTASAMLAKYVPG